MDKAEDDYTVRLKATYKEPNPTAVIYNDGAMIFYEGLPDPDDESLHEGIYNSYTGWDTANYGRQSGDYDIPPWYNDNMDYLKIKDVSFSGHVTPKKTTAGWFKNCYMLSFNASGLDTSNVINMKDMFYGCTIDNLDLSEFKTNNVESMSYMFYNSSISHIDGISKWDTSSLVNLEYMFSESSVIEEINLSDWNVSTVENMANMFANSRDVVTINLSKWNPKKVESIISMFQNCKKLTTIYAGDWTTNSNVAKEYTVFNNSPLLPNYNPYNYGGSNAKPSDQGGYFTSPQ